MASTDRGVETEARIMTAILRSLGAAIVLVLVATASVSAAGPERYSEDGTIDGWVFAECDGFDVVADGWFAFDEAVYTNRDGTLRIVHRFSWEYTLSRTDLETVVRTGGGRAVLLAPLDGHPTGTWVGAHTIEPSETTGVERCEHVVP
jgi:hypothetical protein